MKILTFESCTNVNVSSCVYTQEGDIVSMLTSLDHAMNHVIVKMTPVEALKHGNALIEAANRARQAK